MDKKTILGSLIVFFKNTDRMRRWQLLALVFGSISIGLGQACSKGFEVSQEATLSSLSSSTGGGTGGTGGGGTGGGSTTPPPIAENQDWVCKPGQDPAPNTLRRMSKQQYSNTMVEIASGMLRYSDRANETYRLLSSLAPVMGIVPGDTRQKNSFATLDQSLSESHTFSYFFVASSTADFAVQNDAWLKRFGGSCMSPVMSGTAVADTCIEGFINNLGKLTLRKKLSTQDVTLFKTIYKDFTNSKDGTAAVIQAMLLHPRFLFMVEVDGTPANGRQDLLNLTDFEIAQRLSFFILGTTPTPAMIADAEAGKFTESEDSLRAMMTKYFTKSGNPYANGSPYNYGHHPASLSPMQRNYYNFYDQWLELSKVPSLPEGPVADINGAIYNDGGRYTWAHNVDTDPYLPGETMNFVTRLTWNENKDFYDLMTDDTSVLQGGIARFYAVPQVDGVTKLPGRAGLLTRAAFLVSGNEDTHPFVRGAFIRRNILCDQLPSPDPDALPDRALAPPDAQPDWTNRDRYTDKTASSTCMTCHSQINPLAYALEDFDSLARNRHGMFEPVFKTTVDGQGRTIASVIGKPMNNSNVQNLKLAYNEIIPQVNGGIELSRELGKSSKANMCFARQVFRHTFGRRETVDDSCLLQDMYTNVTASSGSIEKMITNLPLSQHFKQKKLAP